MRILKVSRQNENQLYKEFAEDTERKNRNKLFSATMWVLFVLSAIAFFYGIVKILFGGYLLIERYAPELVTDLLTMVMPLLFPLIIVACGYSIYDMLYRNGESWGLVRGKRIIIKKLANNELTDYISSLEDDGKIAKPEPERRAATGEEIRAILEKGGVLHERGRNNQT